MEMNKNIPDNAGCANKPNNFRKPPYVYWELRDILQFTVNCFPINNKLSTVGVFQHKNSRQNFLTETRNSPFPNDRPRLLLDFRLAKAVPNVESIVELFGYIEMETVMPVLIVKFWVELKDDVHNYVEILKERRRFVPIEYTVFVDKSTDDSLLDSVDESDTSYFSEIDDSFLNNHIDAVEILTDEIDKFLNIEKDLFL